MSESQRRSIRGARSVQRILSSASRIFGRTGYRGASMGDVAKEAGVSKGLLHYHFRSKEHLLIEAQRATFKQIHKRFAERTQRGDRGLAAALDAFDAMWDSVRALRAVAPFIVETLALVSQDGDLGTELEQFYNDSTGLLEDGIRRVFQEDLGALALPPGRMAVLIRIALGGLVLELSRSRSDQSLKQVDQAYADIRLLFERFALASAKRSEDTNSNDALPLPW